MNSFYASDVQFRSLNLNAFFVALKTLFYSLKNIGSSTHKNSTFRIYINRCTVSELYLRLQLDQAGNSINIRHIVCAYLWFKVNKQKGSCGVHILSFRDQCLRFDFVKEDRVILQCEHDGTLIGAIDNSKKFEAFLLP